MLRGATRLVKLTSTGALGIVLGIEPLEHKCVQAAKAYYRITHVQIIKHVKENCVRDTPKIRGIAENAFGFIPSI